MLNDGASRPKAVVSAVTCERGVSDRGRQRVAKRVFLRRRTAASFDPFLEEIGFLVGKLFTGGVRRPVARERSVYMLSEG